MFRNIVTFRLVTVAVAVTLVAIACGDGSGVPPTRDPSLPPHVPDAANGERLFKSESCSACHSTGTRNATGPGLAGIGQIASVRVETLTADEYLEQSIRDPGAYIVDGYGNRMPRTYSRLPQDDVDDLIAYLKTLE